MNIFAKIFGPSPKNLAPSGAPIAVAQSLALGGYAARRPDAPTPDRFTVKYGTDEYLPGIRWRAGRFNLPNPPRVSRGMFASFIKEAAPLFTPEASEKLKALEAEFARAGQQLEEYSFLRVGALVRASFPGIKAALRAGETLPEAPSYEETQARTVTIRRALHELRADVGKQAFPLIREACDKFYATGQKLVAEQEGQERNGLFRRWKVAAFVPSPVLRQLVFLTLSAHDPVLSLLMQPSADPVKLWGHLIESQPAPLPKGITMQEVREQQRDEAERRRNRELDAEKATHKKRVAALNEFNDRIRSQDPGTPLHLPGYRARAASPIPAAEPPATQPPAPETPEAEAPPAKQ